MNLVIVESPAKGRTIEKYLGKGYRVLASFGHVRDLPKSKLGVDVAKNYEPTYVVPTKAKKVISQLRSAMGENNSVYLATDYDREGEAIAWHIVQALHLNSKKTAVKRITFHEITKEAIDDALAHPRSIDPHLVDAQQARRVLDRLVGYRLSPFLWKKVYTGLSAGRVQSVAVRLIVDREREREKFVPAEYWSIEADLLAKKEPFTAHLLSRDGKKVEKLAIKTESGAKTIIHDLEEARYRVAAISQKTITRNPYPPFTTSTLAQTASQKLGYSAKRTMTLAQRLYEAGFITYMRTDSLNLSAGSIAKARSYISKQFGKDYVPVSPRVYKTRSKGAQEAHEAIRPTDPAKSEVASELDADQAKLYQLIWRRFIACQMVAARLEQSSVDIKTKGKTGEYLFRSSGQRVVFDGFLKLGPEKLEGKQLPALTEGQVVELEQLRSEQHFTEPPPRYNEATLIKTLEEFGIGRPSTYAPTISTIVERGYVTLENRQFAPQEVAYIVIDILKEHFPDIVDVHFTAKMEEDLDAIAAGKQQWVKVVDEFYQPFEKRLVEKEKTVKKQKTEEPTDEVCELCGKPMVIKLGRYGRFLACTGFPKCKNTKPFLKTTGLVCPECKKGELVERTTRRRRTFWGCSTYPKCQYATWDDPTKDKKDEKNYSSINSTGN